MDNVRLISLCLFCYIDSYFSDSVNSFCSTARYGADGQENLEFRILHVYYSAKRAVNKGISLPWDVSMSPPPNKKRRTKRTQNRCLDHSPTHIHSSSSQASSSFSCSSPSQDGYETMRPPSPTVQQYGYHHPFHNHHPYHPSPHHHHHHHLHHYRHAPYVSPRDSTGYSNRVATSRREVFRRSHYTMVNDAPGKTRSRTNTLVSPVRSSIEHQALQRIQTAPSEDSRGQDTPPPIHKHSVQSQDSYDTKPSIPVMDPFDLDSGSLKDIDSYWNDPLLSIMLKPSHENKSTPSHTPSLPPLKQNRTLMARLETLQISIRELILQAPNTDEQDVLLSMVTKWANELAKDPLSDPVLSRQPTVESEDVSSKGSNDESSKVSNVEQKNP